MRHVPALAAILLLAGCEQVESRIDLERMREQPRYDPYEASALFADEKVMQHPPEGTVPVDEIVAAPLLTRGEAGGEHAHEIPIEVTPELIELGRSRWAIFCAVCHGQAGYGGSIVAANMEHMVPPLRAVAREAPPGMIYHHIIEGPGRMPSYRQELSLRERWAVVAWMKRELWRVPPTAGAASVDSTRAHHRHARHHHHD